MKLAPIVPIPNLSDIVDYKYHLCLTYLCNQYPEYKEFYKGLASDGKHHVILDNSVHELRKPDSVGTLLNLAREIKPQEVVLPDHINDMEATLLAATQCKALLSCACDVMGVPQGVTFREWTLCLQKLVWLGIDTVGVTRYSWNDGERVSLVRYITENYRDSLKIHLLGWHPKDDYYLGVNYRSTDTAKPAVMAHFNCTVGSGDLLEGRTWPGRPDNFFTTKVDSDRLWYNLSTMQEGLNAQPSNT